MAERCSEFSGCILLGDVAIRRYLHLVRCKLRLPEHKTMELTQRNRLKGENQASTNIGVEGNYRVMRLRDMAGMLQGNRNTTPNGSCLLS